MATLKVIKMGNPRLRMSSQVVERSEIVNSDFQQFVNDLIETMRVNNGAGIAAPQVDVLQRIFTMEMTDNPRYPDKEAFPLHVAINPEIAYLSQETVDSWEGCLSIPNIRGRLKRHKHIRLTALDRNGNEYVTELEGFAAVVAQHELDHLNGVLLIDRMDSMETLTFQEEYEKYWV